ncbi:helix-turn-helix domain-containing protein [Chondrinema litorale]|uniref:helix-turn-helix domain-containing protein n=1 Tax=Chondrinema litorale TaxID=2994555 RepID=UPI00254323D0|nr:helix-turn-helix domain-containing protein [Chondrinema litorale]UZR98251.1 helix-turn-helix domain-containing protein [Chondrinema litorale]
MKLLHNWKNDILINKIEDLPETLPGDWFALYFEEEKDKLTKVYLKPLNEDYQHFFPKENGVVLTFKRNLIEEDDKEYALDVLNLFNLTPNNCLNISSEFQERFVHVKMLLLIEFADADNSDILIKSMLKVLLLLLIKLQHKGFINYELNQKRVYMFLQLMEIHYATHNWADFYAKRMGISEKRLNQILKEKLNKTAKQIIQQRQLTEIKRMLQTDAYSIKEIAYKLSFQSLSDFSRFFKRHTGLSPSQFKQSL